MERDEPKDEDGLLSFNTECPDILKSAFKEVKGLLANDPIVFKCARTLLAGYRLQQWAVHALDEAKVAPVVVQFLVQHIKIKAMKPFKEERLKEILQQEILPFVSERVLEHLRDKTVEIRRRKK